MTPSADTDRIRAAAPIESIIGQYITLKRGGNADELLSVCPFHDDSTPSFTVTISKGLYRCFGCLAAGDVFTFVGKIEGLNFVDSLKRVAELAGVGGPAMAGAGGACANSGKVAKPILRPVVEPKEMRPRTVVAEYHYCDEFGELMYTVSRTDPKGFFQRNSDGKANMDGVRRVLYRLPVLADADEVILVEGEKDVHTLESLGFVATTLSGGSSQKWIQDYTDALRGKRIIIIPDNDDPGRAHATKVAQALAGNVRECIAVTLPKGKDASEFVEQGGTREELLALVASARADVTQKQLQDRGLWSPTEIIENFEGGLNAFMDPSLRKQGLMTGFVGFDKMTRGLKGGELMILAARPSMGKSALALDIASHVAAQGKTVAFFSLEMDKASLLSRLMCSWARISSQRMYDGLGMDERRQIQLALNEICGLNIFFDDDGATGLPHVQRKLELLRGTHGLDLVVIDYLQLMATAKGQSREQEVAGLSRGMKLMAKTLDVPFIALSQLSRSCDTRPGDHKPQLSDLRESGGIEQDADLVAFVFREEYYHRDREDLRGVAELILEKQRNGPTGPVPLVFLKELARFENRAY